MSRSLFPGRLPGSLDRLSRFLWAAALLTLPVTSFRYFPLMGETTYVRPLSAYPIALLLMVLFFQFLGDRKRLAWPGALTPLAAFGLAALLATVLGVLFGPLALRGQAYWGRALRAWATLILGLAFFFSAIWMNRTESELRFTIKWILAGLVLDILWSGLQAATFYLHVLPKPLVTHWQRAFSMRELIKTNRINGMAYEPSWLAGQIATVYLPWLFASLMTGWRVTRFKWLEPLLLVLAVLLVLATFSRGGLLSIGASATLTLLLVGRSQLRAARTWFISGVRLGRGWIWRVGMMVVVTAFGVGALVFLGQKGYIARLWSTNATSIEDFVIRNSAGARAAYTLASLGVYAEHPWMGVGLGASGFYLYDHLPDWTMTTVPEIARQLSPQSTLYPNPKNFYLRLLAETGLIGFFLFLAFHFSLLGDALRAINQNAPSLRFLGTAAIFTWLALVFYNLTQDSFATPNLWVNLGVLAGISAFGIQSGGTLTDVA